MYSLSSKSKSLSAYQEIKVEDDWR